MNPNATVKTSNLVSVSYLLRLALNNYLVYIDGKRKSISDLSALEIGRTYTKLSMDLREIRVTSIKV
jgi:hypothetical protein